MQKQYYIPRDNGGLDLWLHNFNSKIANYAAKYGITPAEIQEVNIITLDFRFRLNLANQIAAYFRQANAYRDALRYGVPAGGTLQLPVPPALAANVIQAAPGGIGRINKIVSAIKAHDAYSEADGNDLGIEGAAHQVDPTTLQPQITGFTGTKGQPAFRWKKGATDGINVYKDAGDGNGFKRYDTDNYPDYEDKAPAPASPVIWKYKAIYLIHGEECGQWSSELSVNVGG